MSKKDIKVTLPGTESGHRTTRWPNSRSDQCEEMAIGAELQTRAAAEPGEGALDGNTTLGKPLLPCRQTLQRDAEVDVCRPADHRQ